MDTIITTGTQVKKSAFVRISVILTGVVIAILCSFIASKNLQSTGDAVMQQGTTVISQNMLVKAATSLGHSVVVFASH